MTKYGDQLIEAEQERMKRAKEAKDKQTAEEYDREQERIKKTRVKG